MFTMTTIALLFLAYLVGSIPTGLIVGKLLYKKDLRDYGSHNIGATNAYRVLGKWGAFLVFAGDLLKGAFGVYIFLGEPELMLLGGILAIIGHSWSIFLKFQGGKGVATGLGVITTLTPPVALLALGVWLILVALTKYVSLGSVVASIVVPLGMYMYNQPPSYVIFGALTALFVIYRHKDNIKRLLAGKELKVERTKE